MSMDSLSLAHTMWNCKYHIVFAPKYRRKVFFKEKRVEVGKILRKLCEFKGITIVEAEICPDHVHMLLEIPPKLSVSGVVGYLIGKSSLMIYQKRGNMKFKYRNRQFWCRGFYVDTVGKNTDRIKEYIKNRLMEDEKSTQLMIEFPDDPLNGELVNQASEDSAWRVHSLPLHAAAGNRELNRSRKAKPPARLVDCY